MPVISAPGGGRGRREDEVGRKREKVKALTCLQLEFALRDPHSRGVN